MFTLKQKTHFWTQVKVSDDPDGCWEWQGSRNDSDHGVIEFLMPSLEGLIPAGFLAHRMAYHFANRQQALFAGVIIHACENRYCCNPNHLRASGVGGVDYDWPWSEHWRQQAYGQGQRDGEEEIRFNLRGEPWNQPSRMVT